MEGQYRMHLKETGRERLTDMNFYAAPSVIRPVHALETGWLRELEGERVKTSLPQTYISVTEDIRASLQTVRQRQAKVGISGKQLTLQLVSVAIS
jgi:hypothetical protein